MREVAGPTPDFHLCPGAATGQTKSAVFPPGGAYVSWHPSHEWAVGFGFFTPFGLGVEWEDPGVFAGRKLATSSQIQGLYSSPVVAWRPAESLAVARGRQVVKPGWARKNKRQKKKKGG